MTQTIEQLTARVRELEEENARLKKHQCAPVCIFHEGDEREELKKQLAASQAYAEQLREALVEARGYLDRMTQEGVRERCDKALALPASREALDAYVAEKVKEAMKKSFDFEMDSLARQRDLAVEALEWALSNINCEPFEWSDEENADAHKAAIEAMLAIKESEEN